MMEIQIRPCALVGDYPRFANVEFLHGWGCRIAFKRVWGQLV